MKKTVESKVADALLQREATAKAGAVELRVAPPSLATLVLVSEQAALVPVPKDGEPMHAQALKMAKEAAPIGRMAAILALGAKEIRKESRWWRRWLPSRAKRIERRVMEELSPSQAASLITQMLAATEMADFFALTAFLAGINKTKPTKAE